MLSGQVLNRRARAQLGRHCYHMTSHFPLFVLMKSCDPGAQGFNRETPAQALVDDRAAVEGNDTDSQIIAKLSGLKKLQHLLSAAPSSGPSQRR